MRRYGAAMSALRDAYERRLARQLAVLECRRWSDARSERGRRSEHIKVYRFFCTKAPPFYRGSELRIKDPQNYRGSELGTEGPQNIKSSDLQRKTGK